MKCATCGHEPSDPAEHTMFLAGLYQARRAVAEAVGQVADDVAYAVGIELARKLSLNVKERVSKQHVVLSISFKDDP